jgi:DNA-binding NarL/FixJ family response regulator
MKRAPRRPYVDRSSRPPSPLRVLLVDHSPLKLRALSRQIGAMPGLKLVGQSGSAYLALRQIRDLAPDLVITDLHIVGASGLELARRAHALRPGIRVIIISVVAGEIRTASLAHGADGFAVVSRLERELASEIKRLFPVWEHPATAADKLDVEAASPSAGALSAKEKS